MNKSTNDGSKINPIKKTVIFFMVTFSVLVSTFIFAVLTHEDSNQRVEFSLIDRKGQTTTQKDLAGRHMLVFFGYSSCPDICTPQLQKISLVMKKLEAVGKEKLINPVFITIDPERDTPEKLDNYLGYFHESVVGLTGKRTAIKKVTNTFSTLLADAPEPKKPMSHENMNHDNLDHSKMNHEMPEDNYLVTHSSMIYVVDQYGRIVDHISFGMNISDIYSKVQSLI